MNTSHMIPIRIDAPLDLTGLLRLEQVSGHPDFQSQLTITATPVIEERHQCPQCVHCCRTINGEVWKLIAIPQKQTTHNGGDTQEEQQDSKYSTFCAAGTEVSTIHAVLNPTYHGDLHIVPAEELPGHGNSCPLGRYEQIISV